MQLHIVDRKHSVNSHFKLYNKTTLLQYCSHALGLNVECFIVLSVFECGGSFGWWNSTMKFRSKYECISPNTHKLLFICTNMIYRANSVYKRLWQNQMKKNSPPETACQYGRCNIDIDRHYSCLQKFLPFMGTWEGGEPQRVYWGSSPPSPPPPDIPRWWCRAPVVTTWGHHLTQPLSVSRVIQQPTCCAVKTIDQTLILYWSYHHTGLTAGLTCN